MKKIFLITLLLLPSFLLMAQTEEEQVKVIRQQFKTISESLDNYTKKVVDLPNEATEGASVIGYFDGLELKLVDAQYAGESGNYQEMYYFWNNKLFFAYTKKENYSSHIMDMYNKVASTIENRYYFDTNENLIRWLENKEKITLNPQNKLNTENDIKKNVNELIDKLSQNNQGE